jgi:collagenase-like PrtC family protease
VGLNSIKEIYLSGPQVYSGSGRVVHELNYIQFKEIVNKIHKEGLTINLIINPTCEGTDWYSSSVVNKKIKFLQKAHEELGIEAVTVANPIYVSEIRRHFPEIDINASVLSDIDCIQRAAIFTDLGATIITPDVNINRDISLLKKIKEVTNLKIKLMVNEGCLYKCPFRKFHFNYMSHRSKELGKREMGTEIFFYHCLRVTKKDLSQILKSGWIRPEDVRQYCKITNSFKIVGRVRPKSFVIRAIKAYLKEEWDGNLLDIVSSSLNLFGLEYGAILDNKSLSKYKFFEKVVSCDRDCSKCSYCMEMAEILIKTKVLTREKLEDLGRKDLADNLQKLGKLPYYA